MPTILLRAKIALTGSSWCLGRSLVPFQGGPEAREVLFFLTAPVVVAGAALYVLFSWLLFRGRRGWTWKISIVQVLLGKNLSKPFFLTEAEGQACYAGWHCSASCSPPSSCSSWSPGTRARPASWHGRAIAAKRVPAKSLNNSDHFRSLIRSLQLGIFGTVLYF